MVGGNIEGVTRTVSIDIYDDVQALNYGAAADTASCGIAPAMIVADANADMKRRSG